MEFAFRLRFSLNSLFLAASTGLPLVLSLRSTTPANPFQYALLVPIGFYAASHNFPPYPTDDDTGFQLQSANYPRTRLSKMPLLLQDNWLFQVHLGASR